MQEFSIPLPSKDIVTLDVPFPMSEEDFEFLMRTLEGWRTPLTQLVGEFDANAKIQKEEPEDRAD